MFGCANEQRCEGLHVQVECRTASIQNQFEAYDSLVIRIPFFKNLMRAHKQGRLGDIEDVSLALADCRHKALNPRNLMIRLGIENRMSAKSRDGGKLHAWDGTFRNIAYCADDCTMFHMKKPDIHCTSHAATQQFGLLFLIQKR